MLTANYLQQTRATFNTSLIAFVSLHVYKITVCDFKFSCHSHALTHDLQQLLFGAYIL